jgi:bacterioferritin
VPGEFKADMETIRERARAEMSMGAITDTYGADVERVIEVLNEALATELVCILRYKRHYYMAEGVKAEVAKAEFLEHANEEQQHADRIAERITQLGGAPDFNPEGLATRAHADYSEGTDLVDMIKENLVAERIAISTYQEIARWLGDDDTTTRRLIEWILEQEEQHADDLISLLNRMDM